MGAKALRYNIRRDIIKCRALCIFFKRLLVVNLGSPDKPRGLSIHSLVSLKRKNLISVTPLKDALNAFIFALNDSAKAFVALLTKKFKTSS